MYTKVYMRARMGCIKSHIGLLIASNQNGPLITAGHLISLPGYNVQDFSDYKYKNKK